MRMILLVGQPRDLLPQIERLVVVDIDGDDQPLLRQAEFLGDQVPGELDRAVLEIVAEREVAEHLEEGVVARRVADIVEVVVLAAGAHAFLRGRGLGVGALFEAGEDVLELHHAGIGEHQGRVVARHERRRRHHGVAVAREVIEELPPDLVDAAHVRSGILPLTAGPANAFGGGYVAAGCPSVQECGLRKVSPQGASCKGIAQIEKVAGRREPGHRRRKANREGDRGVIPPRPRRRRFLHPSSPARIFSAIRPAFWRIAASIRAAISGFCLRKVLAFSRPWPMRWLS